MCDSGAERECVSSVFGVRSCEIPSKSVLRQNKSLVFPECLDLLDLLVPSTICCITEGVEATCAVTVGAVYHDASQKQSETNNHRLALLRERANTPFTVTPERSKYTRQMARSIAVLCVITT